MQAKTFYAPEDIWRRFKAYCTKYGSSMNARIGHLVKQDMEQGETVWSLYKGIDKDLRKQYERLCELAGVTPQQRLERMVREDCHQMIEKVK